MKKALYAMLIAAAALIAGCTSDSGKDEIGGGSEEFGHVELVAESSGEVESLTRAQVTLPSSAIPAIEKFSLRITGTYPDDMGQMQPYDQSWPSISQYNSPKMRRSTYTASINYGDMAVEGPTAACFSGSKEFTVLARKTISVEVKATLQNSAFKVVFDEWFNKYYKDAKITIRTESNNSFIFNTSSTSLIFIKPATKLFMKGEAVKSQTGVAVTFPETLVGTSAARTLHTLTIKASEAGSGKLVIDLDDTFTEVEEEVIELNPDAK